MRSILFLNILASSFICFIGNGCIAQKSGPQITKDFEVSNFEILHLEIVGKVIFQQSPTAYLTIEGDENLIEKITTTNENNRLSVKLNQNRNINNKSNLTFKIGSPNLTQLEYNSVGTVKIKDKFEGETLHVIHSGVGNLNIENCKLDAFRLDFDAVGSCKISGTSHTTYIQADGVGSIDCSNLKSEVATVKSDGVGSVSVHAKEEVDISASGIGNVSYYGNPDIVKAQASGVGKIKEVN